MSALSLEITPQEQRTLERFYYYEARLLDSRQYQSWLGLLTQDLSYSMPARVNVQVDNRLRGREDMISVERELEGVEGMGAPLREENLFHIALRVERAYKINAWAENPPARTRRIVGNIEVLAREGSAWSVVSNFHLYFARPGSGNNLYSGQRRDTLQLTDDGFRVSRREVIMDYAEIDKPTLGLLF